MKIKTYIIVSRAVEEGVRGGVNKAHKYTDHPSEDELCEHVYTYVMNALCEIMSFDDDFESDEE